ncbi:MAG: threonylcarbamoyl-AMP synthase [Bdellovibrionales bacterium]|nr:threonylcarbamoyl-AMP synthase [Bdellovibrionales bacterium]
MNVTELNKAIECLRNDDLVGMPTETVYGLAGSIYSKTALHKIFQIKERPFFDPLIVHVSSVDEAKDLVKVWPRSADILAQKFWPGPLTLILEKSDKVNDLITSGLSTVGIRMPNHPVALDLIKAFGSPLAAPSANKFKKTSPTSAQHVKDEFGESVYVLEGGSCTVGLESTILYINEQDNELAIEVLRKGFISLSEIEKVLNENGLHSKSANLLNSILAPGNMKDHYMPKKPLVILNEGKSLKDINLKFESFVEMSLSKSPEIAARELYSHLRLAGAGSEDIIIFKKMLWHTGELWEAVFDRLSKAASEIC